MVDSTRKRIGVLFCMLSREAPALDFSSRKSLKTTGLFLR